MPEVTAAALSPASRGRVVLRAPTRRILSRTLLYVLLVVGGLAMLFPFAWMVSTSFKPDVAVFQTPPQLIPKPFQPSNYSTVVHIFPVCRFLVYILLRAAVCLPLNGGTGASVANNLFSSQLRRWGVLFFLSLRARAVCR